MTATQANLIGGALSLFFTIALLSYLIGDNILYRLALHTFIGVAAGYVALVVIYQVLVPRLILPLMSDDVTTMILASVPLILFLFLIFKISPRTASLGNVSIAYLIGVGTGVATGGALTGTLVPLIGAAGQSLIPRNGGGIVAVISSLVIAAGTITTIFTFQYWLRGESSGGTAIKTPVVRVLGEIGRGFLTLTLGAIYGGMILSGIAVLSQRFYALAQWAASIF